MLKSLDDLKLHIGNVRKKRLVVCNAHDDYIIDAITKAKELGFVDAILIGRKVEIIDLLNKRNKNVNDYVIVDSNDDVESAYLSVEMIRVNKADILMKGLIDTNVLLKAVVNKETGIREKKLLSHVTLLSYPNLNRVLFATDCAMVINPSLDDKQEIIENALTVTKSLGYSKPLVGIVSAVEKVNPKMQSTVDASLLKEIYKNRSDLVLDGPFAIDNLVSFESAKHKNITSNVAGACDILVFPNIESGNVFYKTSVFLANATAAGIIIGAKCPIVLTSRADSSESKLNAIILSVIYNG